MNTLPKCAETNCHTDAALILADVPRCVGCHRARNHGRIV